MHLWRQAFRSPFFAFTPLVRTESRRPQHHAGYVDWRRFHSNRIGAIVHEDKQVRVLIPRGVDALEQKGEQLRKDRQNALDTAEAAILRKQLHPHPRSLVFDGDPAASPYRHAAPEFALRWGDTTRQVRLTPRKFKGRLGRRVLHTIVLTSDSPAEVRDALNVVQECLRSPSLRKNMDPMVLCGLLRRAAAVGVYQEVFDRIMVPDSVFRKHRTASFYLEALRIHALRTPFYFSSLRGARRSAAGPGSPSKEPGDGSIGKEPSDGSPSERPSAITISTSSLSRASSSGPPPSPSIINKVRAVLWELHSRATQSPAREMCLAYALANLNKHSFPDPEPLAELTAVLARIEAMQPKLPFYPGATPEITSRTDLLMYHEALRMSKLARFEMTRRKLESALSKNSKNRPLQQHSLVDASDIWATVGRSPPRWGSYDKRFAFFDRNDTL